MIVYAKEEDIPKIFPLLVEMKRTSNLNLPDLNPQKMYAALLQCVEEGVVFLGIEDGKVAGVLALKPGTHWFSDGVFLGDLVFYVGTAFRASTLGANLLRVASHYATMAGLPLMMAVVTGVDAERKHNLYRRIGFKPIGGVYCRGL